MRRVSRVPAVAGALREGKLDEAIKIADRYKKSHLAMPVARVCRSFQAHQEAPISVRIEASRRALNVLVIAGIHRASCKLGYLSDPPRAFRRSGTVAEHNASTSRGRAQNLLESVPSPEAF